MATVGIVLIAIGFIGLCWSLHMISMTWFCSETTFDRLIEDLKRPQTIMTVTKRGLFVVRYHISTTYNGGHSGYEYQRPAVPFGIIIETFLRSLNAMNWVRKTFARQKYGATFSLNNSYENADIVIDCMDFFAKHEMKYQILYDTRFTLLDKFIAFDKYPDVHMYCSKEDLVALKLVHNIQT